MGLQATAIMSVEVDSSRVNQQVRLAQSQLAAVPKRIASVVRLDTAKVAAAVAKANTQIAKIPERIAPVVTLDTSRIKGQVAQVKAQMAEISGQKVLQRTDVAASLKKAVAEAGSQAKLAEKIGMSQMAISYALSRESQGFSKKFVEALRQAEIVPKDAILAEGVVDKRRKVMAEIAKVQAPTPQIAQQIVKAAEEANKAIPQAFAGTGEKITQAVTDDLKKSAPGMMAKIKNIFDANRGKFSAAIGAGVAAGTTGAGALAGSPIIQLLTGLGGGAAFTGAAIPSGIVGVFAGYLASAYTRFKAQIPKELTGAFDRRDLISSIENTVRPKNLVGPIDPKNLAQLTDLANFSGVSRGSLSEILSGKKQSITGKEIGLLKKAGIIPEEAVIAKELAGFTAFMGKEMQTAWGKIKEASMNAASFMGKKTDFVKSFEWGAYARALTAEAEAAFSKETVGRKIFSKLFGFAGMGGQIGYTVGLWSQTIAGAAKGIVSGGLVLIEKSVKDIQGARILVPFAKAARYAMEGIVNVFNAFVNKYSIAVAGAIANTLVKGVTIGFQKAFSAVRALGNKLSSMLGSIFSGFGRGGGGGGSDGRSSFLSELGNISLPGILLTGSFFSSAAAAANLQEKMLAIATITQQSGASLQKSYRDVIAVSNDYGKSALDVAQALYGISSASFQGADGLLVLRNSLAVAKGGFADVATVSDAISRTLRSFNLDASESSKVADILFNVQKRGITTISELSSQIPRLAAVFAAAGGSVEDMGALLANLTRNGQLTEQAVLGLSGLMKSFIAPNDEAANAIRALGIEWSEAAIRSKGFINVIKDAAPTIIANKDKFRAVAGEMVALKSLLVLAQSVTNTPGGATSLQADLDAMSQRGAAAQAAATVAIGFNEQLNKFWTTFLNILRSVGAARLPILSTVIEAVNDLLAKVAAFVNVDPSEFFNKLKTGFVNSAAAFGDLAIATWEVVKTVGASVLESAWAGLKAVGTGIVTLFTEYVWPALTDGLWNVFTSLFAKIGSAVEGIASGVSGAVNSFFFPAMNTEAVAAPQAAQVVQPVVEKTAEKILSDIVIAVKVPEVDFSQARAAIENIGKSFAETSKEIEKASPASALDKQRAAISEAMLEIGKTYAAESVSVFLGADQQRAKIMRRFLDEQSNQLAQINAQIEDSPLNKAIERQQKLYEAKARAERDQDAAEMVRVAKRIADNEMLLVALERQKQQQQTAVMKTSTVSQIDLLKQYADQARNLIKSSQGGVTGLNKLSEVLDDIFGKDVERISQKYGVGGDLAKSRELAKDVITARASGFSASDIDTIVSRGITQEGSPLLTRVFTSLARSGNKTMGVEDVAPFQQDLVVLLDRLEKLGLSEQGRLGIFKGRISPLAFEFLDKQVAEGDREASLIDQAMKQFSNIAQQRSEQERFNKAQNDLNSLLKENVTHVTNLTKEADELEVIVKKVKEELAKRKLQDSVSNSAGGPQ